MLLIWIGTWNGLTAVDGVLYPNELRHLKELMLPYSLVQREGYHTQRDTQKRLTKKEVWTGYI
jgi:hypothetical protein